MGYLEPADSTCAPDAVEPHLQKRLANVHDGARSTLSSNPAFVSIAIGGPTAARQR